MVMVPVCIHDIFPFVNKKRLQFGKLDKTFQCNHLDFEYHNVQTLCINPSILIMSWVPKRSVSKETAPVSIHDIIRKLPSIWQTGETNPSINCSHLDFKYHTDHTMCIILEKLSNPSILTFVLGAQKNRLQGDCSCEYP